MKLQNSITGDVLEVPPPDPAGASVVLFNGRLVERVFYGDDNGGSVTLQDGRRFSGDGWAAYLVEQLKTGAYNSGTEAA